MSHITQKDRVKEWLKLDGRITSLEAFKELGITRLSAIIFDIRHELLQNGGKFSIKTNIISGTNRFGDETHYAEYILLNKDGTNYKATKAGQKG